MSTTATIAKNTFFNGITNASDLLVNFMISIVLARDLGTEQYGLYSFLMWFLAFCTTLVNLGLGDMAKVFIAEALGQSDRRKGGGIAQLTLILRVSSGALVAVVLLTFSGFWANLFGSASYQPYFVLVAAGLLPSVLNYILISLYAGFQKYQYGAYLTLATNPLRALTIILLVVFGYGVREMLLANIGAWVLGVVVGTLLLRRLVPVKYLLSPAILDTGTRNAAVKYALTLAAMPIVAEILWRQGETLFIGMYRPAEDVGFYNLASRLPSVVTSLIPMAFGAVLLPAVAEQFGRGDVAKIRAVYVTSARYVTMLCFPIVAAGVALSGPLIAVLYGPDYAPVVPIMQALFLPYAVMAMSQVPTAIIYGGNRPAFALKVGLVLAVLSVGLSLLLIPRYGLMGAAIGSSVPRVLILAFYLPFVARKINVGWPVKDTVKIALASVATGVVAFVAGRELPPIPALVLAAAVGLPVYVAVLLAVKAVGRDDLRILRRLQGSLPRALQGWYCSVVALAERLVANSGLENPGAKGSSERVSR